MAPSGSQLREVRRRGVNDDGLPLPAARRRARRPDNLGCGPDGTDLDEVRDVLRGGPAAVVLPETLDRLSLAATVELLASLKQLDNGAGVYLIATHPLDPETPAGTAAARRLAQQFATAMGTPVVFRTARAIRTAESQAREAQTASRRGDPSDTGT